MATFIDPDGALVIPGNWTTVPGSAFQACSALESVSFSASCALPSDPELKAILALVLDLVVVSVVQVVA